MRYLSVCSGIEAATVAWHSLGWTPVAFSEIEKFPSQVLSHHYPTVPNLGDMTKFKEWNLGAIDLLVGGTPCQSFSVAGLRKGLDDPRGNLMLTYLAIAEQFKPKWLVWENVPGVLSSNGGKDFGSLLGGLAELGYGFAYRILDAQYFGVPQRRRRVFVVGCLGDWRAAAAVLFERHSLQGNSAPQREAGKGVAGTISKCSFDGGAGGRPEGAAAGHFQVVGTLGARTGLSIGAQDAACGHMIATFDRQSSGEYGTAKIASTVSARDYKGAADLVTYETVPTLTSNGDAHSGFRDEHGLGVGWSEELTASVDLAGTLQRGGNGGRHDGVMVHSQVRRLTPRECERLQGFPDDYTLIPVGKRIAADGPRYKALGNSMAVPVMHWIGDRIAQVEQISDAKVAA
ncbi:DNA cytosine methyltransferase [Undibacterium baiyunense]|uniref:Cytosine-specific methyltransferase n=1 Tax=Undibacterium baiyunense TaxID=2828731 RepID=A0A941DET7_9BURK|nr:DNA (cytosine-5-)-methyltransferase [Undibacterium baiyunense]MBR7747434.1 DNA (cytosine-5-)-methyltransferase [Undibacterium baiyunense]